MDIDSDGAIVIYGGTGFLGTAVCEVAARRGFDCLSISRNGSLPTHLKANQLPWLGKVQWLTGDATHPDVEMLKGARAIINLVGSPPLPTFSQSAFDHQLKMNGESQERVLEAADLAAVNRVVLMGADIPSLLQTEAFAYYCGKQQALSAAQTFAASNDLHQAYVLQPGGIYGTRYTAKGAALPLSWFMSPLSALQQAMPQAIQKVLPASFVDVKRVATAAVELAVDDDVMADDFAVVTNSQLLQWPL